MLSVAVCEEGIANLPNENLEIMLQGLQVSHHHQLKFNIFYISLHLFCLQLILENLKQQEKDIDTLVSKSGEIPNVADLEQLLKQLKQKVVFLIARATNGVTLITVNYL